MIESRKKTLVGKVVSAKCEKTRVVSVKRSFQHKLYKKIVSKWKRIMIHDVDNKSKLGDIVKIVECRPISKKKRWSLLSVLDK